MKKIIDGKMNNTETAILVAEYNNGFGCGDFHYVCEELYLLKRMHFFVL